MRLLLLSVVVLALGYSSYTSADEPGQDSDAPELPFVMPVLDGWRTETIPFPVEFAPDLNYTGLEELRFAPGMFKEGSEDFWTYAFVWWLTGEAEIEVTKLEKELVGYFDGLMTAVADGKEIDLEYPGAKVELQQLGSDPLRLQGTAETVDAFVTQKQITLNVLIEELGCPAPDITVVFFALSPQPLEHEVWSSLARIQSGFECSNTD